MRAVPGLVCAAMLAVPPAAALDVRYVDTDGDLVADTPAKTVDPPTLIFAYTPGEDPASYQRVWDDFLQHLEKTTGKRIRLFAAQNNAAQIEAMRAGRLHIAGFGTGTVPIAVNCAGFVPFAIMGGEKGILGYEMEIIAAAIANEVMHRMMARDVVKKDQIVTVYKSETFPTAAFGLAHNLDPAVAAKVRAAFLSYPWAGTGLEKEFSSLGVSKFVPITYQKDWAVVRKVDAAMNVSYDCK